MKNKVKKAVSRAMREKAEEALTGLNNYPNVMSRLVIGPKIDSKKVEGGWCMRGSDGRLCISDKEEVKIVRTIWKGS